MLIQIIMVVVYNDFCHFQQTIYPFFIHRQNMYTWSSQRRDHSVGRWRHQMETFSALLAFCVGNSPVTGEVPTQRPVTRSFDGSFDLRLNKRLNKQSRRWWFETQSRSLWRHCKGSKGHPSPNGGSVLRPENSPGWRDEPRVGGADYTGC